MAPAHQRAAIASTGQIASGAVAERDRVCLQHAMRDDLQLTVLEIEQMARRVESASAGQIVGLRLSDIEEVDIARGDRMVGGGCGPAATIEGG